MPGKFNSATKSILFLLSCLLVAAAMGSAGISLYADLLLDKVHYVDPDTTPTLSQAQLDACHTQETGELLPDPTEPELPEMTDPAKPIVSGSTVNILLIGQDRLEGEARARSDTMILCTLHKDTKTLTLTSFLRDLYVQIPGYRSNRINTAYTAGGMKLLNETLEANFGIQIDGNLEVDFSGFAEIIDALGGVTLELRQDEAEVINKSTPGDLSAGTMLLNGKQALAYARIRKLDADGDFSRTARQRKLLEVLFEACRSSSAATLLKLLNQVLPLVTTDMTKDTLIDLALTALPMLPQLQIKSQYIPADGTYSYQTIRGMSVLKADMNAARQLLQDTLSCSGG